MGHINAFDVSCSFSMSNSHIAIPETPAFFSFSFVLLETLLELQVPFSLTNASLTFESLFFKSPYDLHSYKLRLPSELVNISQYLAVHN